MSAVSASQGRLDIMKALLDAGADPANQLDPSMSRRGNCWDNAVAESFFSSLKKERVRKRNYKPAT